MELMAVRGVVPSRIQSEPAGVSALSAIQAAIQAAKEASKNAPTYRKGRWMTPEEVEADECGDVVRDAVEDGAGSQRINQQQEPCER